MRINTPMLISVISTLIAIGAIIISYLALRESRLANRLNIEPLITIYPSDTLTGTELQVFIENKGKVDVEGLIAVWVTIQKTPSSKDIIRSGSSPICNMFKAKNEVTWKLNLKEQIEEKRKDKKGNIIFLGIKAVYRRASDAKAGEYTYYFTLSIHEFGISVEDITSWKLEGFLSAKKELNKYFYR